MLGTAAAGAGPPGPEGGGRLSAIVAMAVADKDPEGSEAPEDSQTTGLLSGQDKARHP